MAYFATLFMQDATIAAKIRQLKDEIKQIEEANREHRKIKRPGYPAQELRRSPHPSCASATGDQSAT
jgi:hypothetical protein